MTSESNYYLYKIEPVHRPLMENASDHETRIMRDHFNHLKQLLADGRLLMAGPCTDEAFGIVVFTAKNDVEAAAVMNSDPAVINKLMTAEIHPFRVSLLAGRD